MAKVRDLAQGTEMPVLISPSFVEGGDPARFANPAVREAYFAAGQFQGRLSEKRYQAEQAGNSGSVHVTVFSLRPWRPAPLCR